MSEALAVCAHLQKLSKCPVGLATGIWDVCFGFLAERRGARSMLVACLVALSASALLDTGVAPLGSYIMHLLTPQW